MLLPVWVASEWDLTPMLTRWNKQLIYNKIEKKPENTNFWDFFLYVAFVLLLIVYICLKDLLFWIDTAWKSMSVEAADDSGKNQGQPCRLRFWYVCVECSSGLCGIKSFFIPSIISYLATYIIYYYIYYTILFGVIKCIPSWLGDTRLPSQLHVANLIRKVAS